MLRICESVLVGSALFVWCSLRNSLVITRVLLGPIRPAAGLLLIIVALAR